MIRHEEWTHESVCSSHVTVKVLGLLRNWRRADAVAITKHHKPLFEAWKSELQDSTRDHLAEIPGFLDSLQRLFDAGYSMTDVGVMVGVCRERVRQWVDSYHLDAPQHGTMFRVWSEDDARFVPIPTEEMLEQARCYLIDEGLYSDMKLYKGRLRRQMNGRRCEQILAVRRLTEKNGQPPTLGQLADEMGLCNPPVRIATDWGKEPNVLRGGARIHGFASCSYRVAFDRLYAAAGVSRRRGLGPTWRTLGASGG